MTFALEEDERLDASKVMLYGGSHGGLIATHLCGQFPVIISVIYNFFCV